MSAQEPLRCSPSAPAQRGAARQQFQLSAGTTSRSRVGDLCGSVRALSSPGLHAVLLELLTSFSGFQHVIHGQDQPTWLETSSAICSHGPSHSAAISRVAQGEVAACPLFLIFCGQFTLYSHSFEDFALPYRDLFRKPHTPLHKCLISHLPKLLSSPGNVWGTCMPSSRLCMCCCDRSIFLFRNLLFSLTIAF